MLVARTTARVEKPLSYRVPPGLELGLGDVVRVPLGPRELFGFVVGEPRDEPDPSPRLRPVSARADVPRAFDDTGIALAQWIAEHYVCSLGEALGAVVLGSAIPRTIDRFVRGDAPLEAAGVPARLTAFIAGDWPDGFTLAALVRHPEARRIGDRARILGYVRALVDAGALVRQRRFDGARVSASTIRVLEPGASETSGKKARALAALVRERGELPRSDAKLGGFSDAVIRRAVESGAVVERRRTVGTRRDDRSVLPDVVPTAEQRAAIATIRALDDARTYGQLLLHGVTGSGKTYVYLAAIADLIARGGRAIVLVPEIALTPQTAGRFRDAFGDRVAVLHSALSDRERFDAWQAAARGEIAVVVGARSAIFAPLPDVRLVVIDEAHEASYKQDTAPRYHAVDVARERMRRAGGVVVLGSATPALDDYARASAGRFPIVRLRERATAQALPRTHVINMAASGESGGRRTFSAELIAALEARVTAGEQSVLFVNRRGSARFVLCRTCGSVPQCGRCAVALVVHRDDGLLRCHYCDAQRAIPPACPRCGDGPLRAYGVGTQRVARELHDLFPRAEVVRMDSDTTTRTGDHARLLEHFAERGDILVGTQMVAKGLDFPRVTLVGVVAADLDLHAADFRAAERTFSLLVQVCGRSGRTRPGEALIQTYAPDHPAIRFAAAHDYDGFAALELADRRNARWPPFARLVYLGTSGRDRDAAHAAIDACAAAIPADERWQVLGPAPAPIARLNDEWRFRLAIKTRDGRALRDVLRANVLPLRSAHAGTRLLINVDP